MISVNITYTLDFSTDVIDCEHISQVSRFSWTDPCTKQIQSGEGLEEVMKMKVSDQSPLLHSLD